MGAMAATALVMLVILFRWLKTEQLDRLGESEFFDVQHGDMRLVPYIELQWRKLQPEKPADLEQPEDRPAEDSNDSDSESSEPTTPGDNVSAPPSPLAREQGWDRARAGQGA